MHHLTDYQSNTSPGKLLFFDRAKKSLESQEYDEFLKLLSLFSKDIVDIQTLIERAKVFLGEGDLMTDFKDLVGWDDRDKVEKGPPGSIRTGPPELPTVLPVDDGEGPSYRKLPPSVRFAIIEMLKSALTYVYRKLNWLVLDEMNFVVQFSMTSGFHILLGLLRNPGSLHIRRRHLKRLFIEARRNDTNIMFKLKLLSGRLQF